VSAAPIDSDIRWRLLEMINIGVSFAAACKRLKLAPRDVQRDAELMAEVLEVHRVASAKLEEHLFVLLLKSKDTKAIATMLERRDRAEAELAAAALHEREDREALLP
jgi:hypothetical protein